MLKYIPKDTEPCHNYMGELTAKLINDRAKRNVQIHSSIVLKKEQNPFDKKKITNTY